MGRLEGSIAEHRRALDAEPLSLIINSSLGWTLIRARRYDQAIEELRKTLDMDPSFVQARLQLGLAYEQKGMFADAIAELRQTVSLSGGAPRCVSTLGHAYAISGQRRMAEQALARLRKQARQRYVAPYDMAEIHIGLGQKEQVFKYLEMAYADHSCLILWLRTDPRFDTIRGDPRYGDLLRRMHLT
jgi:Flp pilus assembly protein TadD